MMERRGFFIASIHTASMGCGKKSSFLSKFPKKLSAIAVIPLTVNKIASSGGYGPIVSAKRVAAIYVVSCRRNFSLHIIRMGKISNYIVINVVGIRHVSSLNVEQTN